MERLPASPDEATQPDEIRRFLGLLIAVGVAVGIVDIILAMVLASPRWVVAGVLLLALAAWLAVSPRRAIRSGNAESVVMQVGVVFIAVAVGFSLLLPFLSLVMAMAVLIPVAFALPYIGVRSLRRLLILSWTGAIAAVAAGFLPADIDAHTPVVESFRLFALAIVIGLVFFFLYRSSARLRASSRDFRQLLGLSSELAETTDPGVLGELVARHLAEAIGFDDCVIYALAPDTDRLAPFGSYPSERALEATPESLAERPMLGRVIRDRARIVIDASVEHADPTERERMLALGRDVMLLLPLFARLEPVGVAELTTSGVRAIDDRRLALAGTLAFEAAMAIDNGRLYQQLRHQALHVLRSRATSHRPAHPSRGGDPRGRVHRSRRLQGSERHARTRPRRPSADARGGAAARGRPSGGHGGPLRRRRVRAPDRGLGASASTYGLPHPGPDGDLGGPTRLAHAQRSAFFGETFGRAREAPRGPPAPTPVPCG